MRGLPEVEEKAVIEALEQAKALVEMALESENVVGLYETVRIAASKLEALAMAMIYLLPLLLSSGEFTQEEIGEESERVNTLIKQFVDMRVGLFRAGPENG